MTGQIDPNLDWRKDPRQAQFDRQVLLRLHAVLAYWERKGYEVTPLPWMAPELAMAHTRPADALVPEPGTHEGALAASGEQAFLWMEHQGLLDPTKSGYIGWAPCFRHEKQYDKHHHHYFLKAELFASAHDDPMARLDEMIESVSGSWRALAISEGRRDLLPERVPTGKYSVDLFVDGVELGSFGVRKNLGGTGPYLYGTALAEPRWSHVWPKS